MASSSSLLFDGPVTDRAKASKTLASVAIPLMHSDRASDRLCTISIICVVDEGGGRDLLKKTKEK